MLIAKTGVAALAISTLVALAAPAGAQNYDRTPNYGSAPHGEVRSDDGRQRFEGGDRLRQREDRLGEWIAHARQDRRVDDGQARRMWGALRSVKDEERNLRFRQGGRLFPDQFGRLNQRLDRIADWVRNAQRGGARDYDGRVWDR